MLGVTTKSDPGVMILENSISSKSRQNKTKKTNFSKTTVTSLPKPIPQHEQLNNWDYCNPANFEDPLPQPYRFINRCLNEMIMNKVYEQVFEIEKFKSNANYEGAVKEILSSGAFEIEGITALGHSEGNPYNHLLAGDYYGNLYLLDLSKKVQITKFQVTSGKRIVHISANTIKDDDYITTIAVICRGDPFIHIFRYKGGENKIFKNFTIPFLKKGETLDRNTNIGQFPYLTRFSPESRFLSCNLYNGNIEIYSIPEPQLQASPSAVSQNEFKSSLKNIQMKITDSPVKSSPPSIVLDVPSIDIIEPFYSIPLKAPLRRKTYEDTLNAFIQTVEKKNVEEIIDPKAPKDKKQAPPPVDQKKQGPNASKQEPIPPVLSEFESNEVQNLGEIVKNDKEADVSNNYKIPDFRGEVFFTTEKLVLSSEVRVFAKVQEYIITTGVTVAWIGQKIIDFHKFQSVIKENLPQLVQLKLKALMPQTPEEQTKVSTILPKKEETKKNPVTPSQNEKKPIEPKTTEPTPLQFEKKLSKTIDVLYNITIAEMNPSNTFFALGLMDGSVFVYDMLLFQEHCYLDKHVSEVTHLKFFEEWTIVSGSADGVIHVYNLKSNALEMKRTNIFKPSQPLAIRGLEISSMGLALVIDNQFNARVYDLRRFDKIMRLLPVSVLDENKKEWICWPNPVISAQKDQFCLMVNQCEKNAPSDCLVTKNYQKNSKLLIFRIFDNLLNIFPALANLSRKGLPKDKICNAFQKMTMEDLKNIQFDIPVISETRESNKSKTLTAIQTKSTRPLPVIHENENPTKLTKMLFAQKKKDEEMKIQDNSKNEKSNPSMSFSKIHTKESELNSSIDLNSSFKTINTIPQLGKSNKAKKTEKTEGLTKEALHPENVLNDAKKLPPPELYHPLKDPIQQTIGFNKDKMLRMEKMEKTFTKINSDLEVQEVKNNLRKKKEMLKNTMK